MLLLKEITVLQDLVIPRRVEDEYVVKTRFVVEQNRQNG